MVEDERGDREAVGEAARCRDSQPIAADEVAARDRWPRRPAKPRSRARSKTLSSSRPPITESMTPPGSDSICHAAYQIISQGRAPRKPPLTGASLLLHMRGKRMVNRRTAGERTPCSIDPRTARTTGAGTATGSRQRRRRARGELDRPGDRALAGPLSAPVELGLGVHRDRLLALRPGARRARAALAVRRAVAQRPAAAHRLHRGRALLPGPRVLADRALPGRAREPAHVGDRPAAGARHRRLQVYRAADDRAGGGVPRELHAEARRLARLPLPGAQPRSARAGRDLAPWESGMDNSPLWDAALARIDARRGRGSRLPARSTSRSSTRRSGRRTPSTTATPTSSSATATAGTTRRAIRGSALRDPGRALQLDARAGEPRPRRDRRDRSARTRRRTTTGPSRTARSIDERSGTEERNVLRPRRRASASTSRSRPRPASRRSTRASRTPSARARCSRRSREFA